MKAVSFRAIADSALHKLTMCSNSFSNEDRSTLSFHSSSSDHQDRAPQSGDTNGTQKQLKDEVSTDLTNVQNTEEHRNANMAMPARGRGWTRDSLRRGSDEKETPRARGGEDCFESVPEDSGTDGESFAVVTAGRNESSASEYQPKESRDVRESATSATCSHELQLQSRSGVTDPLVHERTPALSSAAA